MLGKELIDSGLKWRTKGAVKIISWYASVIELQQRIAISGYLDSFICLAIVFHQTKKNITIFNLWQSVLEILEIHLDNRYLRT